MYNSLEEGIEATISYLVTEMDTIDSDFRNSVAFDLCQVTLMNSDTGTDSTITLDFLDEAMLLCTLRADLISFERGVPL